MAKTKDSKPFTYRFNFFYVFRGFYKQILEGVLRSDLNLVWISG